MLFPDVEQKAPLEQWTLLIISEKKKLFLQFPPAEEKKTLPLPLDPQKIGLLDEEKPKALKTKKKLSERKFYKGVLVFV